MKKTLAVLAVLMVAAAAQAELLATWTIASSAQSVANKGTGDNEYIQFQPMVANGLGGALNGTSWRLNNWNGTGVENGNSLSLPFQLYGDSENHFTFTLEQVVVPMSVNGNPSPAQFEFRKDSATGAAITDVWTTDSTGAKTATFTANDAAVWTSGDDTLNGSLHLVSLGKNSAGGNASSGSRTDVRSGVDVYGAVTPAGAVPEPATMSLLGLGALAMALRRKLRK